MQPNRLNLRLVALLFLLSSRAIAVAQGIVAQGEYQTGTDLGTPGARTVSKWVLYARTSGGYRLESKIQNLPPQIRVIQVEDLDNALIPTAVEYDLFRNGAQKAEIVLRCEFVVDTVACHGLTKSGPFVASEPHKIRRPFWFWVEGLFTMDLPWLFDGTANMANLATGTVRVTTVTVSGGTAGPLVDAINLARLETTKAERTSIVAPQGHRDPTWEFSSEEEAALEFIGTEPVAIDGRKVLARHYILRASDEPKNLWLAGNGLLVKIDEFVLAHYKQSKRLIPEIDVAPRAREDD